MSGFNIVQQTLIVGDDNTTGIGSFQFIHSFGHNTQAHQYPVRSQSRPRCCRRRFQHSHLEYFIPLLLTTRETLIYRTVGQLAVQLHHLHAFRRISFKNSLAVKAGKSFVLTLFIHSSTHKVHHAHARDLHRILEN